MKEYPECLENTIEGFISQDLQGVTESSYGTDKNMRRVTNV